MPILNKSLRTRRSTSRLVGDKKYGAPGGCPESPAFVCSYGVADRAAAELGLDREHCHRFLIGLGRVMQRMLLEGDVVGLPFLGVLVIQEHRRRVSMAGMRAAWAALGREGLPAEADGTISVARRPRLMMAEELRVVFKDSAVYRGPWRGIVAEKRAQLKRRLYTTRGGKGTALRHTKEGPIMETEQEIKKRAKPGMMVEDANAVVDTAEGGQQTVRKVADRPAEAERQGKDECAL